MITAIKITNSILILLSLYMGIKHGWAMVNGDSKALDMFSKWDIGKTGVLILGVIGIVSSILIVFPKTFFLGNLLTAAVLLLITALCLQQKDLKGAMIELPFLILPLVIIYLQHPLAKS